MNPTLIRNLVKLARKITLPLLSAVTHETPKTVDKYGKVTSWNTATTIYGFVQKEQKKALLDTGSEITSHLQLIIPQAVTITVKDKIIFPDATTAPIVNVVAIPEPAGTTNFFVEVWFGSSL